MPNIQWDTPALLSLLVWICTLPIVALVIAFFGWGAGLTTAAILLVAILIACWLLCFGAFWRIAKLDDEEEIG